MHEAKFHFISGLPRSGSTLLGALLLQNKRFHASMSSPVAPLLQSMSQSLGIRNEWSPLIDGEQRRRILASLFYAYHGSDPEKDTIFDTSRAWCARLPLLAELFPDARIIACVRDPKWVINSFETIFRKNPFLMSRLFTADQSQTVYSRVDTLAAGDGAYGFASRALKEAYYGEHAHRLILLEADLTSRAWLRLPKGAVRIRTTAVGTEMAAAMAMAMAMAAEVGTARLHTIYPVAASKASIRAASQPR